MTTFYDRFIPIDDILLKTKYIVTLCSLSEISLLLSFPYGTAILLLSLSLLLKRTSLVYKSKQNNVSLRLTSAVAFCVG